MVQAKVEEMGAALSSATTFSLALADVARTDAGSGTADGVEGGGEAAVGGGAGRRAARSTLPPHHLRPQTP